MMRIPPADDVLDTDVKPMRNDAGVTALVTRARNGDTQAWDALVERYAPLIWCLCRRHRLSGADAADVGQNVWLQLVDHLDTVRDPAALPGWLATTTRRECRRVLRKARGLHPAGYVPDVENIPDERAGTAEQELLAAERHAAVREAFAGLSPSSQQLMALLIQDPPVPYAEISVRLSIPVGSIGPYRGRCLEKLRRHPAIAALMDENTGKAEFPILRRDCAISHRTVVRDDWTESGVIDPVHTDRPFSTTNTRSVPAPAGRSSSR